MKKKTLLKLIFTVSCLLAAYCLLNNRETMALNQLAFQNIEALANGEDEGNTDCFGRGSVDCRGYHVEDKISGYSLE